MNSAEEKLSFDFSAMFARVWMGAAATAAVCVAVNAFVPQWRWVLVIPFAAGALAGIVAELSITNAAEETIEAEPIDEQETEPEEPFHSDFYVALQKQKKPTTGQLDLFEQIVEDPSERRKIGHITTQRGEIYVIQCTRFQDLLLSRIVDDIDKATDHALAVAMRRHVRTVDPDRESLFRRSFRETVKNDFRGSVARLISRVGDKLINELRKEAGGGAPEQGEFRLESPRSAKRVS